LRQWIDLAFERKAKQFQKCVVRPKTFHEVLALLFRKWTLNEKLMDVIGFHDKDAVKNDFARLGLFESSENKIIARKLNRFFTTGSFYENIPAIQSGQQLTDHIIENNHVGLLMESFINFDHIEHQLNTKNALHMHNELILMCAMRELLSAETDLPKLRDLVNATSIYIDSFKGSFNPNDPELRFIDKTLEGIESNDFGSIAGVNNFTIALMNKLKSKNSLPTVTQLLESFHDIRLKFITEDMERPSFNDTCLSDLYGEHVRMDYKNYVEQHRSSFAAFMLFRDILKRKTAISRKHIQMRCEHVVQLAFDNPNDRELVSHVVALLEMVAIDSTNVRCYLRLRKLDDSVNDGREFSERINEAICLHEESEESLSNVEALETFWQAKNIKDPPRNYLSSFAIEKDDWLRLVLIAQYLNYSKSSFVEQFKKLSSKNLRNNVIRAVVFEGDELEDKRTNFSKKIPKTVRHDKNEVS